ncbi:VOC family protein [Dictyobacter kobayashii]|uniref:VOC domain-containing protein n=1 Tax=Dictyobacter kobayashii TaxID=2014872 RepID=A0A402AZ90_9CHLR|nr:hypothetical protein [Dictyobacter kobayashii]GCE24426.1 hypothetical protein KDK_82260 [Dictyobacter kobayashii]
MHIRALILQTRQLAEQKEFYTAILGLPLFNETATAFTIQAGTTRLTFQETQQEVLYHIAFTIPRNKFEQAKRWIAQRITLLPTKAGDDEIFFSGLNARSFYFGDADNNILEYMVHNSLDYEAAGDFGPEDVLRVSEIGLPVEDVLARAAQLEEQQGIVSYPAESQISDAFAYLGDISGQFVVVKAGRPWLPTETVPAIVSPVQVVIDGLREQQFQLASYPYTIVVGAVAG